MEIKKNKILVQIGTNTGCDAFNEVVRKNHPEKVILVEPNASLNPWIRVYYKGISNVLIENVAITDVEKGLVKLVIPKAGKGGRSGNGVKYNHKHYSLLPMDDWGSKFEELEVPSMTFGALCEKHGIEHIHFLQVDTEGYDSEIIKSIDFDRITIDIIQYENWTFGEDCFKRYGDGSKLYGVNGMKAVSDLLIKQGYLLKIGKYNITAIKN